MTGQDTPSHPRWTCDQLGVCQGLASPCHGCTGSGACQQGRHSSNCDCGWLRQDNSDGSDAGEAGIHAEATMGEAFRWLAVTLALVALAVWLGLVAGYWSAP